MTRQEVHRFLYGNDEDVDEIVVGAGFLGELKNSLEGAESQMGLVHADRVADENLTAERSFHSCILPYYFINSLANFVLYDIDLDSQFVSEFFDEVCVFTSNDGSIIYAGTFYELLMKVTSFTEIYTGDDELWEQIYNPVYRYVGQCGDYEGRALFFEADWHWHWRLYTMIVFAPMTIGAFDYMQVEFDEDDAIILPDVAFSVEMFDPYFDCDELCPGHYGVGIFGVSDATPMGVQTETAAIAIYEENIL